jgi:hypothetical protein
VLCFVLAVGDPSSSELDSTSENPDSAVSSVCNMGYGGGRQCFQLQKVRRLVGLVQPLESAQVQNKKSRTGGSCVSCEFEFVFEMNFFFVTVWVLLPAGGKNPRDDEKKMFFSRLVLEFYPK